MNENEVDTTEASRLAALFSFKDIEQAWTPSDLSAIWEHQLSSPILEALDCVDASLGNELKAALSSSQDRRPSFGALLHSADTPVAPLNLCKRVAKAMLTDPDCGLPQDILTALYFGVIGAALVRHDARISSQTEGGLMKGFEWSSSRSWLDEKTRLLLEEAAGKVSLGAGTTPDEREKGQ